MNPLSASRDATVPLFLALPAERLAPASVFPRSPGTNVEVEVLEDEITVDDDRVVRVTKLRIVSAPARTEDPAPRVSGIAHLISAATWEQIRITVVDGHTVRISCGKRAIRRTYRDLGLHAKNSREPTRKWTMLLAICAGHGTFLWRDFGPFGAVSQATSILRAALKEAFGLHEDPFHDYKNGWRSRFFATSEIGE